MDGNGLQLLAEKMETGVCGMAQHGKNIGAKVRLLSGAEHVRTLFDVRQALFGVKAGEPVQAR